MKYFKILLAIVIITQMKAQTNVAGPENVLVVYNSLNSISQNIANYYKTSRNIPNENMKGISIPSTWDDSGHRIRVLDNNELIVDLDGNRDSDKFSIYNNTMQYVKQYITQPIENYLNNTIVNGELLANRIRFIVVCKGIPFKATSWLEDFGHGTDLSRRGIAVDALISIINQSDPNFSITNPSFISSSWYSSTYSNPYFHIEDSDGPNYNFSYRFSTKTYQNNSGFELNYLVSRLDGYDYNDITSMIDRGISPNLSGENYFVLDGDDQSYTGADVAFCRTDVLGANGKLIGLGFNTIENETDVVITTSSPSQHITTYQSSGSHSDALLFADYCVDVLAFNYVNGATFNTYESFNGYVLDVNNLGDNDITFGKRQAHFFEPDGPYHYQGLISDFIHAGGTGGEAHVYEPLVYTVSQGNYSWPSYAMGYSLVESIYMGLPYLVYRNIIIGDPLTTIAWGRQTLTQNLTWSSTNLVTGEVTIPSGKILTINNNSTINLKHSGFIATTGTLAVGSNVTLNISSWQKGLIKSNSSNHPKLVWGTHPSFNPITHYRIYRKKGTPNFELVATVLSSIHEYIDLDTDILTGPYQANEWSAEYYIKAKNSSDSSEASNTIRYDRVEGEGQSKIAVKFDSKVSSYALAQNYPNPFNPHTQIKYSLKEDGFVTLKLFDILGNEIATLVNEAKTQGNYTIDFNSSNLSSGVYIYQLKANNYIASKKMIITK